MAASNPAEEQHLRSICTNASRAARLVNSGARDYKPSIFNSGRGRQRWTAERLSPVCASAAWRSPDGGLRPDPSSHRSIARRRVPPDRSIRFRWSSIMRAKNPERGNAPLNKPTDAGSAAVPPPAFPTAGAIPPASKLSAAFGAVLGGKTPPGHIHRAGNDGPKPGHDRPDQINKAPKPAAGPRKTVSPGHGHR